MYLSKIFVFYSKGPSTPWDNNFWLDLDFLSIAMAAQYCSAYFTSLLCIEIWTRILQYVCLLLSPVDID